MKCDSKDDQGGGREEDMPGRGRWGSAQYRYVLELVVSLADEPQDSPWQSGVSP